MGVPRFFRFVQDNYGGSVNTKIEEKIDNICLDMNALIHQWSQYIYGYGEYEGKYGEKEIEERRREPEKLEEEMFDLITKQIGDLTDELKPERLIVCFDGPAPLAKIAQQRSRRYRAGDYSQNSYGWTSAKFSPGTELMDRLNEHVREYLEQMEGKLAKRIIYSSVRVPGEGEHKILTYIKEEKKTSVIIGNDADLIILGMISNKNKKIYVMRLNDYLPPQVVNTNLLSNLIKKDMNSSNINDFIILSFMIGNDFLHSLPELHDLLYSLPIMIRVYKNLTKEHKNFTLSSSDNVNWTNLLLYLSTLLDFEKLFLKPDEKLPIFKQATLSIRDKVYIDPNLFDIVYYRHIFGIWDSHSSSPDISKSAISDICSCWLSTLYWNFLYYLGLNTNNTWQYTFHYTPLLRSLVPFLSNNLSNINLITSPINISTPFLSPLQQLSSILPIDALYLLPSDLESQLLSLLPDFYPISFQSDPFMALFPYQSLALLPFISVSRLISAFSRMSLSSSTLLANRTESPIFINS